MVNVGWKYLAVASTSLLVGIVSVGLWALNRTPTRTVSKAEVEKAVSTAITEDRGSDGVVTLMSASLPVDGQRTDKGNRVEWRACAIVKANSIVSMFLLQSPSKEGGDWIGAEGQPMVLIGDGRRYDLKPERAVTPGADRLVTSIEAVGRLDELRLLARSKSSMIIVGANMIPLSPQAVATCRELLRRAMRAQHQMTGVDEQESSRLVAEALRDGRH